MTKVWMQEVVVVEVRLRSHAEDAAGELAPLNLTKELRPYQSLPSCICYSPVSSEESGMGSLPLFGSGRLGDPVPEFSRSVGVVAGDLPSRRRHHRSRGTTPSK